MKSFEVGEWTVHPSLNRLSKNGDDVRVEPKVMQVLEALAENEDGAITLVEIVERELADQAPREGQGGGAERIALRDRAQVRGIDRQVGVTEPGAAAVGAHEMVRALVEERALAARTRGPAGAAKRIAHACALRS